MLNLNGVLIFTQLCCWMEDAEPHLSLFFFKPPSGFLTNDSGFSLIFPLCLLLSLVAFNRVFFLLLLHSMCRHHLHLCVCVCAFCWHVFLRRALGHDIKPTFLRGLPLHCSRTINTRARTLQMSSNMLNVAWWHIYMLGRGRELSHIIH